MAAKNSSPELSFGDWEDKDRDELLSSECQEGGRFANLQDIDLNIVTESYSKSPKTNTKWAPKVFQGKYSDIEIHFHSLINLETALNGFDCCRQVSWRRVCSFSSACKSVFFWYYLHFYAIFYTH